MTRTITSRYEGHVVSNAQKDIQDFTKYMFDEYDTDTLIVSKKEQPASTEAIQVHFIDYDFYLSEVDIPTGDSNEVRTMRDGAGISYFVTSLLSQLAPETLRQFKLDEFIVSKAHADKAVSEGSSATDAAKGLPEDIQKHLDEINDTIERMIENERKAAKSEKRWERFYKLCMVLWFIVLAAYVIGLFFV